MEAPETKNEKLVHREVNTSDLLARTFSMYQQSLISRFGCFRQCGNSEDFTTTGPTTTESEKYYRID